MKKKSSWFANWSGGNSVMAINVLHILTQEHIRRKSIQLRFIESQTTPLLRAHVNVYQRTCMMSDILIDDGRFTLSLALGCGVVART